MKHATKDTPHICIKRILEFIGLKSMFFDYK
jgi:hypothetical protein